MPLLIAQIILAVIQAVPVVNSWVQQIIEAVLQGKIADIDSRYSGIDKERSAVLHSISEAKTHEQKALLFTTLNRIK